MQAKSAITIADKYVLVRKLATDASTELYLARKTDATGAVAQVVVRRLLADLAQREDLQEMFRDEARIASSLEHPNILRVVEVGGAPADPFIAMEFIQGHPLARVEQAQAQRGSGIPPQYGLAIVLDVARGLFYAHEKGAPQQIIHRFLSPHKIVVGYDGLSRIIDFGVTRPWFRVNDGDVATALDRVRYLAPEQVKGQPVGPWTDVFSLGTILYELTTGRAPFDGATPQDVTRAIVECKPEAPRSFVPGYPEEMESLVLQALAILPEKRFPSASAMAAALEVFLVRHELQPHATSASVAAYLRGLFGGGAAPTAAGPTTATASASAPKVAPKSELDLGADDATPVEAPRGAGPQAMDLELGDAGPLDLMEVTGSLLLPVEPAPKPRASPPRPPPPPPPAQAKQSRLKPAAPPPPPADTRAPWDGSAESRPPAAAVPIPRSVDASPEALQLRERVTTLAKENALLRQEVLPLRDELAIVKPGLAAKTGEAAALASEKAKLDAQLAKLTEDIAGLRTDLAAAKADSAATMAASNATLVSTEQRLQAASTREEQARKDLATASERESKTRRDLEVYKARDGVMRKELDAVKAREAAAKGELEMLGMRASVLEKTADESRKAIESAKREAEMAKREANIAKQEAGTAKKAAEAKEAAVTRQIEAVAREAIAKRDADVAAIEAATRRIVEEARASAEAAKKQAATVLAELDGAKATAAKAKLDAEKWKREVDDAKAEIGVAHHALQSVLEENASKIASEAESGKKAASASEDADSARKSQAAAKAEAEAALAAAAAARAEAAAALKEAEAAKEDRARAEAAARDAEERRRTLEMADEDQSAARKAEVAAAMQVVRTAMQEADASRAEAEAAKAEAEAARVEADAARQEALAAAARAETMKVDAEAARTEAEATRAAAEKARAEAGEARRAAEAALVEADAAAQSAEAKKAEAATALEEEREARRRRESEQKEIEDAQIQVLAKAMHSIELAKQESDDALLAAEAAKAEANAAREEAAVARAEGEAARREAEALRRDAETAHREADDAKREADAMRREAEGARREVEALRAAAASAKAAVSVPAPAPEAPKPSPTIDVVPAAPPEMGVAAPAAKAPQESAARRYLASVAALPKSNLIAIPGAFVGRGDALRALEPLVAGNVTEVTLVGSPGSGRTRLARRFASQHLAELSKTGGVWFVDLAGCRDIPTVCAALASALGVAIPPSKDASYGIEHLGAVLTARGRILLILDGADEAASALGIAIEAWRGSTKELRVLAVAEKALGIAGERVMDAGALALPAADASVDSEAGRLFVARAREQNKDGGPMPPASDPDICRIVRLLRGAPLAIELIAARSEDFTIAALYTDLVETLGGDAAPDAREMLTRVLDWSWSRLATWEQDALAQASVFACEFTAEAATAVLDLRDHPDAPTIDEVLRALVAASLLRVRAGADARDPERFEMHPAVRAFSSDRLAESTDAGAASARHAGWALRAGRALASSLEGPSAAAALRRLELFQRDLEATLSRALETAPPTKESCERALDSVRSLEPLWSRRGLLGPGIELASAAIEASEVPDVDAAFLAEARLVRGRMRRLIGKLNDADADLQEARVAAAAVEDRKFEARVLAEVGLTMAARGQGELARHSLDQALALARRVEDVRLEAQLLGHLGTVSRNLGRVELARTCAEQAAGLATGLADKRLEAEMSHLAGAHAREMGALADARRHLERALALSPSMQDRGFDGRVLAALADLGLEEGRLDDSRDLFKAALEPLSTLGLRRDEAAARGNLGVLEHLAGHLDDAKARFATASRLLDDIGDRALDGLYLAHLAALEAAKGATDNAAAVFETARRRIKDGAGGAPLLAAADVLTGFLDLARAKKAPDAAARKAHRDAALKKIPDPKSGAAARIAGALLTKATTD